MARDDSQIQLVHRRNSPSVRAKIIAVGLTMLVIGSDQQLASAQSQADIANQKSILDLSQPQIEKPQPSNELLAYQGTVIVTRDKDSAKADEARHIDPAQAAKAAQNQPKPSAKLEGDAGTFTSSWRPSEDPQSEGFAPPSPPRGMLEPRDESLQNSRSLENNDLPVVQPIAPPVQAANEIETSSLPVQNMLPGDSLRARLSSRQNHETNAELATESSERLAPLSREAPIEPVQPESPSRVPDMPSTVLDPQVRSATFNQSSQLGGGLNQGFTPGQRQRPTNIAAPTAMVPPNGQAAQLPGQIGSQRNFSGNLGAQSTANRSPSLSTKLVNLRPAEQLISRFNLDKHSLLPGTPVSLYEMLSQPMATQNRDALIRQYWETYYDWAALVVAREHYEWSQRLPGNLSLGEKLLVQAEQRLANDRLLAAQIQMGKSQSRLLDFFTNPRADDFLPLPSDPPTVKPYTTHYETMRKRRTLPSSLRGIDQMLEGTNRLIGQRALTVNAARQARTQLLAGVPTKQASLASVIQAAELNRAAELDLISSVVNYNQAISNYVVTAFPAPSAEKLVTYLVGAGWKTRLQNRNGSSRPSQVASRQDNHLSSSIPTQGRSILETAPNVSDNISQGNTQSSLSTMPPRAEDVLPMRSNGLANSSRIAGQGGLVGRNEFRTGTPPTEAPPRLQPMSTRNSSIADQSPAIPNLNQNGTLPRPTRTAALPESPLNLGGQRPFNGNTLPQNRPPVNADNGFKIGG